MALITIPKARFPLFNGPFDAKLANYYVDGNVIKVETIAQYLARVITVYRMPGVMVTILTPKEGYTSLGTYPINTFKTIVSNFDIKYYTFVDGVENINFEEVDFGFTYVAFASDDIGTDFSLTPVEGLNYIAILQSNVKIPIPIAADFDGLWFTIGYTLPPATTTTLGGIIVGAGLHVTETGLLSTDADLYLGTWNAATNTPTIADGVGIFGQWYWVTVGGIWNGITFEAGDVVVYNGTIWERVPRGGSITDSYVTGASFNTGTRVLSLTRNNSLSTLTAILGITSGLGMEFDPEQAVTLGLPSTIDSTTENALTAHSHTHKIGLIDVGNIIVGNDYGALINYKAATDVRNLTSSSAWTVMNGDDWLELFDYVDVFPYSNVRTNLNQLNFNIRFGGVRYGENREVPSATDGTFGEIFSNGNFLSLDYFTTAVPIFQEFVKRVIFSTSYTGVDVSYTGYTTSTTVETGFSIRLVRDASPAELLDLEDGDLADPYIANNGNIHNAVKIGNKIYLAQNLNETKYRNGDYIHGYDGGTYTPILASNWKNLAIGGMCYYDDNEDYGGGSTTISNTLIDIQNQINNIPAQIQPDWNQTNNLLLDYIKNKPSAAVTAGSSKISLGGTPSTAALTAFSIDVNEANLTLNNIGGTLGISKGGTGLTALGTALQLIRVNAGATALEYFTPNYLTDAPANGSLYGRKDNAWTLITDSSYTHPTQTAIDTTLLTGANVISRIIVNTLGHTTSVETRALNLGNLGYTGATDADKYGSWIFRALDTAGNTIGTSNSITSGAVAAIKAGNSNITLTSSGGVITISSTDTNTTYSNGTGLSLSGTTFNHSNSVVASTASEGGVSRLLAFGSTFNIPSVSYDAQGHITGKGSITLTMPANPASTTYSLDGSSSVANSVYLELISSAPSTDFVNFVGTGYTTVSWDEGTQKITINSTDRDTNLSPSYGASSVQLNSSTGTSATINSANGSTAGVLTAADWTLLHSLSTTGYNYWNVGVAGTYNQVNDGDSVNFTSSGMTTIGRNDVGGITTISISTTDAPDLTYIYGRVLGSWIAMNGAVSALLANNLTANRAIYSNASGKIVASSNVTDTELEYLDGVTSAIQTQLNGKAALNGSTSQYFQASQIDYPGTNHWITKGTSGGLFEIMYFTSPSTYSTKLSLDTSGNITANALLLPGSCNVNSSGGFVRLVNGASSLSIDSSGNGIFNGTVTASNFNLVSDKRFKENIAPINTEKKNIEFVEFNMVNSEEKRYGVIAQQVEEVAPELVRTNEDGMKSVAYIDLLIMKIAELEARLKKLENA